MAKLRSLLFTYRPGQGLDVWWSALLEFPLRNFGFEFRVLLFLSELLRRVCKVAISNCLLFSFVMAVSRSAVSNSASIGRVFIKFCVGGGGGSPNSVERIRVWLKSDKNNTLHEDLRIFITLFLVALPWLPLIVMGKIISR